ncbi:MAG: hypothetical protein AB9866_01280 [Syntrophobacteraceae bacterium]
MGQSRRRKFFGQPGQPQLFISEYAFEAGSIAISIAGHRSPSRAERSGIRHSG